MSWSPETATTDPNNATSASGYARKGMSLNAGRVCFPGSLTSCVLRAFRGWVSPIWRDSSSGCKTLASCNHNSMSRFQAGDFQTASCSQFGASRVNRTLCEGFDPGSERTLAAWIRHASRTNAGSNTGGSGERGSNAWVPTPGLSIAVLTDG